MIEENALSDAGLGIDVRLKDLRGAALQVEREIAAPVIPEPVGQPVGLKRMETLEIAV